MNAIVVGLIGIVVLALGYRFYSKILANKIFSLDLSFVTPPLNLGDGVDYVPTNKIKLWGPHVTSVAGADPILGHAVAGCWGWIPAVLCVIRATGFAARVHEFGTPVVAVRNKGHTVGTISDKLVGQRAKTLFLFIILILALMVNAVFAWVIANLIISF